MVKLAEGVRIVDADAHMTERHDLFTSRAPKGFEDKVPHVEKIDGMDMWVLDGHTFGKAGSGGTIDLDGNKHPWTDSQGGSWGIDDVHRSAWDPAARLEIMDEFGIDFQVIYPNSIGLGGQNLVNTVQRSRARAAVRPAVQRRVGRDAGGVGQPPHPDADHAGVEHRRVRARSEALRGDGIPRREHDVRSAGLGIARPRQPGVGSVLGRVRRAPAARCTSTSVPARRRSTTSAPRTGRARTTTSSPRSAARRCSRTTRGSCSTARTRGCSTVTRI